MFLYSCSDSCCADSDRPPGAIYRALYILIVRPLSCLWEGGPSRDTFHKAFAFHAKFVDTVRAAPASYSLWGRGRRRHRRPKSSQ